jgi:nucleoside-diphosphate-sugar epimerase
MWTEENALVIGGNGFLGGMITKKLLAKKCRSVSIFCRKDCPDLAELGADVIKGDIRDFPSIDNACENRTILFHTAAKAGIWGKKKDFFSVNVDGTKNLIRAAYNKKAKIIVHTSSPSVAIPESGIENGDESLPYPEKFLSCYQESKAIAEKIIIAANSSKLSTVCLRPHLIWGPEDPHILPRLIARAKRGNLVRIGDGKNLVDLTYIENAAEAHILAAEELRNSQKCAGRKYFISDGNPVNLWDWINSFLAALGLSPLHKSISAKKAALIASASEFFYKILSINQEPMLTRFAVAQLSTSHYFDISAARRDFGYSPIVDTKTAFSKTVEWFKKLTEEKI